MATALSCLISRRPADNVNGNKKSLGIDIGGTKTLIAAVDGSGAIHGRRSFPTGSERGFEFGLERMAKEIQNVLKEANFDVNDLQGIGIGCTGPVNPIRGTIHNPYTLPGWENAEIVAGLRNLFGVNVRLENDADAAAVGEFHFGAGRKANSLVMVTIGTGIGGAVLFEGRIHRGVDGEHPELGHISVLKNGPECYCGTQGCWESLACGSAITTEAKKVALKDSRAVFAARETNAQAAAIIQRALDATSAATWTILHTFLPQRIIIGGGIGEAHFELFAEPMRMQVSRATQIPKNRVEIVKAQLGEDAGVVGAAALAFASQ